jgi:hypothetical protein
VLVPKFPHALIPQNCNILRHAAGVSAATLRPANALNFGIAVHMKSSQGLNWSKQRGDLLIEKMPNPKRCLQDALFEGW